MQYIIPVFLKVAGCVRLVGYDLRNQCGLAFSCKFYWEKYFFDLHEWRFSAVAGIKLTLGNTKKGLYICRNWNMQGIPCRSPTSNLEPQTEDPCILENDRHPNVSGCIVI